MTFNQLPGSQDKVEKKKPSLFPSLVQFDRNFFHKIFSSSKALMYLKSDKYQIYFLILSTEDQNTLGAFLKPACHGVNKLECKIWMLNKFLSFTFFSQEFTEHFIQNIHEYHSRKIYRMHNSTCTRKHSRQVKKLYNSSKFL